LQKPAGCASSDWMPANRTPSTMLHVKAFTLVAAAILSAGPRSAAAAIAALLPFDDARCRTSQSTDEMSLLQMDLRVCSRETSGDALSAVAGGCRGQGSDIEEDVSIDDMSLIQTDLVYTQNLQRQPQLESAWRNASAFFEDVAPVRVVMASSHTETAAGLPLPSAQLGPAGSHRSIQSQGTRAAKRAAQTVEVQRNDGPMAMMGVRSASRGRHLLWRHLRGSSASKSSAIWFVGLAVVISVFGFTFYRQTAAEPSPSASHLLSATEEAEGRQSIASRATATTVKSVGLPTAFGATMVDVSNGPPTICASLILPNTEARFVISMDSLLRVTTGSLDILGTSGRKLLHASIEDTHDGRRCLALSSVGCEADPRCLIYTPKDGVGMEVFGRRKSFYGTIERSNDTSSILKYEDTPVMLIEAGSVADLKMTARTADCDRKIIGSAGRHEGKGLRQPKGGDAWKFQVKPGTDAVLVCACMLAVLLLQPRSGGIMTEPSYSVRSRSPAPSLPCGSQPGSHPDLQAVS